MTNRKTEPQGAASEPATSGDVAKPRGRPATRNRPSLLWAVWRMVRIEIAYKGAPNALQACARIMERHRVIKIEGLPKAAAIVGAATLHQWYRAAEQARTTDAQLAAQCSAWELRAEAQWPDHAASVAAGASMDESDRAGLMQAGYILEAVARANAVAERARLDAGKLPRPRKNRRP